MFNAGARKIILGLNFFKKFSFSESSIKGSVERVIKIWEERKLFEKEYLEALRNKLGKPIHC